MEGIFRFDYLVHGFQEGQRTLLVHEVAGIDAGSVNELALEVLILHQAPEQTGAFIAVGSPVVVAIEGRVVEPLEYFIAGAAVVESQSEVGVLQHKAPFATIGLRTPHHEVVTGSIQVDVVEVRQHDVDKFLPVHALGIFCQRVSMGSVECLELVEAVHGTFLQLVPVLYHVDILQFVIVVVDVVLVRTLADVQHARILSVDVDNGRTPCLPVQIDVAGHRTLDDSVAHKEVVEVVACIAQHETLEILQTRLLVGEELIVKALRTKTLVGIHGKGLAGGTSRGTTGYTCLTQLVEHARLP